MAMSNTCRQPCGLLWAPLSVGCEVMLDVTTGCFDAPDDDAYSADMPVFDDGAAPRDVMRA
jgi:hypothetical protein